MIRLAICDDNSENLEYMKEEICRAFRDSGRSDELDVSVFHTGEELVNAHIADTIDVFFMDIELENNRLGFDVARQLCRQNVIYTENAIINHILNRKIEFCEDNGIPVKCMVCGSFDGVSDYDIHIILENLIDNAIEASQ